MRDLTTGNEGKRILYFAIPMLLGNFFQILNTLVDSIIVGNYIGKSALAAIGSAFPVIFALISLVIGISAGISIVISQYYGAKDLARVKRAIDTAFIFLIGSSAILGIVGIIFAPQIFSSLHLSDEAMHEAVTYMRIYLMGIVFMAGFNGAMGILRGLGDSKTPLVFLIIVTISNIVLEIIFIIWLKLGIAGAAYATIGSQVLGFVISVAYLNRSHEIVNLRFFKMVFDKEIFKLSLKIGLPSGMQQIFVALGMVALIRIVNEFGTNAMAAYTIAGRIDSFASLPAMNFSMALSSFVGQNIGAGFYSRVKRGLRATIILSGSVAVIMSILIGLFATPLMQAFTSDAEVVKIGANYLLIVCTFYLLFTLMFAFTGLLRGAGDTIIPMFITLFSLWIVRIPLAVFLSSRYGIDGVWWAIPIAWGMGMIASYLYYKTGRWRNKRVVKTPPVEPDIQLFD
jgi:putative MATE family efflux protein